VTIDLEAHGALCVRFRRDSFVASFGSDDDFVRENGARGEKYLDWLRTRIRDYPEGHVHIWQGDSIVGQIEFRLRGETPVGYVNLFYLVPEARGSGLGDRLHEYILALLRQAGLRKAQLSVSPTNARAVSYYRKHGWTDLGPRPGHDRVNLMELVVESSPGAPAAR
jgi:ribosomal protein S18 acetylase RimI-like enzyme